MPKGIGRPRGRVKGSEVSIREMELNEIASLKLTCCLSYLAESSDLVVVSTCGRFRKILVLCDCLKGQGTSKPDIIDVEIRYEAVKANIQIAVSLINGQAGEVLHNGQISGTDIWLIFQILSVHLNTVKKLQKSL